MSLTTRIKKYSSKPIHITTRDALIVTVLTLVATMLCMFAFEKITGTPQDYFTLAIQTAALSMSAQYLYEYSGVNNMIAESSIRYTKGSTLAKYASRRSALLCDVYSAIKESKYASSVGDRYQILRDAINTPSTQQILPQYILDHISQEMICDMLINGFDDYTTRPKFIIATQLSDSAIAAESRGETILEEIGFYTE